MWAIHKPNDGLDVVVLEEADKSRLITVCDTERAALEQGIRIAGANIQQLKDEIRLEQDNIESFQARLRHLLYFNS